MTCNTYWKPNEIIVHESVKEDPVTTRILSKCPDTAFRYVRDGRSQSIVKASSILSSFHGTMLDTIKAGKRVLYIAPATGGIVDTFKISDNRILCPQFDRLKIGSNQCIYFCDWCYLKLTFRSVYPYMTARAEYPKVQKQIEKRLRNVSEPITFNSGELADSLVLEHLTGAAQYFVPFFGNQENGYLFMLTKSDNVGNLLDLPHNSHTIISWSLNTPIISTRYEIGAPSFDRRLAAARKVQEAGYRLRLRLDPILPFQGWQEAYSQTIHDIFSVLNPERITIGTLRFEKGFYGMRDTIFTTGKALRRFVDPMEPMFPPMHTNGRQQPLIGKYSFPESQRIRTFRYIVDQIRQFSEIPIALCKESYSVIKAVGLDPNNIQCVCQN